MVQLVAGGPIAAVNSCCHCLQRRWLPHPQEQPPHRAVPQQIHVIDRIGAATMPATFNPAAEPGPPATVTCLPANSPSPARCANPSTETNPAADTKFGSSNTAQRTGATTAPGATTATWSTPTTGSLRRP